MNISRKVSCSRPGIPYVIPNAALAVSAMMMPTTSVPAVAPSVMPATLIRPSG